MGEQHRSDDPDRDAEMMLSDAASHILSALTDARARYFEKDDDRSGDAARAAHDARERCAAAPDVDIGGARMRVPS